MNCILPIARKQRIVAWSTKTFDFGSRYIATEKSERQFQPSRPLLTSKINCFSDWGVSRRLNSRISSSAVSFESPTFTKIRSDEIPRLAKIFSTAGRISVTISSMVAPKIAIFGSRFSGRKNFVTSLPFSSTNVSFKLSISSRKLLIAISRKST